MEADIEGRSLTVEDLYGLPDDGIRYELQAGMLLSEPLPGARQGLVTARIVQLLDEAARKRGLGSVMAGGAGFVLARSPDLAIEVLSPSDRPGEVHAKVADYLAAGTRRVWVVDPDRRRVTVYGSLLSPRLVVADDRLEGEDVVPGFDVAIADLFEF